tara:strand:+ start:3967 stop:4833 length:867 start_codon:yes stop_codon:yes gene_type:complete
MAAMYKIIFKGEILDDSKKPQIESALCKHFKIPKEKSSLLFNGKSYALKKELSAEKAIEYQGKFSKIGIVTHFIKEETLADEITSQEPVTNDDVKSKCTKNNNTSSTIDIWFAIKSVAGMHLGLSGLLFGLAILSKDGFIANNFLTIIIFSNIITLSFTTKMWKSLSAGYVTDLELDTFSFPASDVENSVQDIVTFKKFRNLMHRNEITLTEVRALNNEKSHRMKQPLMEKKKVRVDVWLLNISGDFGSQQFEFDSKQKRDECRSMLFTACAQKGNKLRGASDLNLDL